MNTLQSFLQNAKPLWTPLVVMLVLGVVAALISHTLYLWVYFLGYPIALTISIVALLRRRKRER